MIAYKIVIKKKKKDIKALIENKKKTNAQEQFIGFRNKFADICIFALYSR